jgi:hypothetical protein
MNQGDQTIPQMLREKRTAQILDCSVAALRKWRRLGSGPKFVRLGRAIRYNLRDLEAYLSEHSSK